MGEKRKPHGQQEERRTLGRQREEALIPVAPSRAGLPQDYTIVLDEIKRRIQQERLRVVMAANSALVLLYWDIGQMILQRQDRAGWGARVIDRLAKDLRNAFPDTKGFSLQESQVHAGIRSSVARSCNCARAACTNYLVSQPRAARETDRE
jgi:hypothetical protein